MLRDRLWKARQLSQEITKINRNIEQIANQINNEVLPQVQKVMRLKQKVAELYQQLGSSEDQSWYETLCCAQEWDQLEPLVSRIMAKGMAKKEEQLTASRSARGGGNQNEQ